MSGIRVEFVTKTFRRGLIGDSVQALKAVSLSIAPGEAFGIIGPNGAGKTTLFGCLLGLLRPDSGDIRIDGHPPDDLAIRRATGYLPERLVLDRWMTGRAFLAYHHALAGLHAADRPRAVSDALDRVGLDTAAAARSIRKYSRGMLQRLGVAQALLGSPRYVFLDEPASGVDPAGVLLLRGVLSDLKRDCVTVVINSHQLDQVERVCDRVAFVKAGRVESIETVAAGATLARVMRVRISGLPPARETLAGLALQARAELRGLEAPFARFSVADDEGAVRLLHALVTSGIAVAEAVPEQSGLERLFVERPGAAPPPAAPPAATTAPVSPYAPPPTGTGTSR